jgi:GNAT superfamily N-acetyltransferase
MPVQQTVEIIDYQTKYQPDFYRLNAAWIEPNFGLEQEDIDFLTNPQGEILNKGGVIFFAKLGEGIVGTCGLYKMDDETYEMIRTAVDENHRGLQIGKRLVEHAIAWCRENPSAKRLVLESSTKPVNARAVKMYEKLGFQHYQPKQEHRSALARADVWMFMDV